METARASIVVNVPTDTAHRRWLEFTGQPPAAAGAAQKVPAEKLPEEVEKGKVYFSDEGGDSTRVAMELYYNPAAVKEAGLSDDWVSRRIELYLKRFKNQAEK